MRRIGFRLNRIGFDDSLFAIPSITWAHFRVEFCASFGDINYQLRLVKQVAGRVQGEEESTADCLTCLQGLYPKFERPVFLIEQMDRAYMNMRLELKHAIRRHEFEDYIQLTSIANDVERMLETIKFKSVPPRPEESCFPEFSYSSKNRLSSFPSNKEKPGRKMDMTVNRLLHSVAEIIRKLDDLKSRSKRISGGNPREITQSGNVHPLE